MGRRRKRKPSKAKKGYRNRSRSRCYNDPVYAQWRDSVRERDGRCCQWPGCGSRRKIQVHHIKRWSKYPGLRFVVANGITLCERCHTAIKGKEVLYEAFFMKILEYQMIKKLKGDL